MKNWLKACAATIVLLGVSLGLSGFYYPRATGFAIGCICAAVFVFALTLAIKEDFFNE